MCTIEFMSLEKSEAFVLKVVRFRARDQVVTVFSREKGLFSLFAAGSKKRGLLEPLMHVELICIPAKGELVKLHDVTTLDTKRPLRQHFRKLQAASAMLNALSSSQLPYKTSPLLYRSLEVHLKKLEEAEDPEILLISFLIKLLKHDSFLRITPTCARCRATPSCIEQGEAVCESHSFIDSFLFTIEEMQCLQLLFDLRNFEELQKLDSPKELCHKVRRLFNQMTKQKAPC